MGQWFMGRSDRFFDNAKEFRPERWVESEVQSVSGKRGEEILRPFSLGVSTVNLAARAKLTSHDSLATALASCKCDGLSNTIHVF